MKKTQLIKIIKEEINKVINEAPYGHSLRDRAATLVRGGERGNPGASIYTGESIFRGEGDVLEFFTSDVYRTAVSRVINSSLAGEGPVSADVAIESIRQLHDYAVKAQDQNPPYEKEFIHSYIALITRHKDWMAAAGIDDNPYANKAVKKYGDSPLRGPTYDHKFDRFED